MKLLHTRRFLLSTCLLFLFTGCAGQNLPAPHKRSAALDPPDRLIIDKKIGDVRYLSIEGFEHMKVDSYLLERIETYEKLQGISEKKSFITTFLQDAFVLNDKVVSDAASRLPEEELAVFFDVDQVQEEEGWDDDDLLDPNVPGDTSRERFVNAYRKHAKKEFAKELSGLDALRDEKEVDRYWYYFLENGEESILTRGRTTRLLATAPLVPIIYAWIWYIALNEDRAPHTPYFIERTTYYPEENSIKTDPVDLTDDWDLLEYYAPVYVLEKAATSNYEPSVDRFGEIWMEETDSSNATPQVHTDKPTVYAYVEHAKQGEDDIRQLVYTRWHSEHPKLRSYDPEAGHMDGWTLRVSLNKQNQPLLFESVANCGCYYKAFPTERLENWSRE